jgi:sulfoquinovosyltransferase
VRNTLSAGNPEAPLLVYVGRLGMEKKLASLKTVLEDNPGARLAFVGSGPFKQELEKIFAGYPVVFVGPYQGDELSAAFASADLFVMPSDSETLGFVVLEAMASGIPVVGVAAGGIVDLIESGSTGYLVSNSDDMREFSSRVKELLGDSELRRAMGVSARKWAESWSWEAATSRLRNVQYRAAIENFGRRRESEADKEKEELLEHFGSLYRPDLC